MSTMTTLRLSDMDIILIGRVKQKLGASSMAETIRMALRHYDQYKEHPTVVIKDKAVKTKRKSNART